MPPSTPRNPRADYMREQAHEKAAHPQWHDQKIRAILSDAGYEVARTGGWTKRAASAWNHYLANSRGGVKTNVAASDWNKSTIGRSANITGNDPIGAAPGSRRGGAQGPGSWKNPKYGHGKQPKGNIVVPGTHHKTSGKNPPAGDTKASPGAGSQVKPRGNLGAAVSGSAVNKLLPTSTAEQLAQLQYGPKIRELATQKAQQGRDAAQRQQDLSSWYSQLGGMQAKGAAENKAVGDKTTGTIKDAVANIIGSLGGGDAGAAVGVAGVNATRTLAADAQSQQNYDNTIAPLIEAAGVDAKARQQNLASQQSQVTDSALAEAAGLKGAAKAQALMQIMQANNAARQSNFGNRLAVINTDLAAQNAGLDQMKTLASIANMSTTNKLNQRKLSLAEQDARGIHDWHALQLPDRNTVIDAAFKAGLARLPKGAPYDPQAILNEGLAYLRNTGGYQSAHKLSYKGKVPNKRNQNEILGALKGAIARGQNTYQQTA